MPVLNNKLGAALMSAVFSLVMLSMAIAPANGGTVLPGITA